ncbi:MAG: Rrf2 family transcriptional regulator [Spirochaetaceae bacterium]|jgi:Rrf2 family protein|nr:Rrf2 family transcriptional regulator [Spirochaetaceae bacterium]
MRISTKGRYSLEAMLFLALKEKDEYSSTHEISEATGISEGYLEQLFIPLRKAGLIQGIRGSHGGYTLGEKGTDICVGDVLRTVESSLKPTPCVEKEYCPDEDACTCHQTWNDLAETINTHIDSICIKNLVADYQTTSEPDYTI